MDNNYKYLVLQEERHKCLLWLQFDFSIGHRGLNRGLGNTRQTKTQNGDKKRV